MIQLQQFDTIPVVQTDRQNYTITRNMGQSPT